jgi:hypothetical protein
MDSVNELPRVAITGGPDKDKVHVGEPATFKAAVTNRDSAAVSFVWRKSAACPADLTAAQATGESLGTQPTARWKIVPGEVPDTTDGYCIFVIATDDKGAQGFAARKVSVIDRRLLLSAPTSFTSGVEATFTASFSDDPAAADKAQFVWTLSSLGLPPDGPCQAAEQEAQTRLTAQAFTSAAFTQRASRKPFCVVAIARDSYDVTYTAKLLVSTITNGGPPADPRVVTPLESPVGIFSHVRMSAAAMGELEPTDVLKFDWKVLSPAGAPIAFKGCEGAKPDNVDICFDVAGAGNYQVSVTTMEGGLTNTGAKQVEVVDRPPCIRLTEPLLPQTVGVSTVVNLYDQERVLKVEAVEDDGDPMPPLGRASEGMFVWSIRVKGDPTFQLLPEAIFSRYAIPARQFRLGDEVEVRVEYRDRLDVSPLTARKLNCGRDDLSCQSSPDSGCFLRVGWKVLYL